MAINSITVFPMSSDSVGIVNSMPGMKMAIVVPLSLGMSPGKVASQVAHAALVAGLKSQTHEGFVSWLLGGMKKIVLETAVESELVDLDNRAKKFGLVSHLVQDEGLTEVPFGSFTALAIGPANGSIIDEVTGGLALLGTSPKGLRGVQHSTNKRE